jgi:hypothetical protein
MVVQTDLGIVTAAKLSNMFGFFKGEWFMDQRVGFPLLQSFLVKDPHLDLLVSILADILRMPQGVQSVVDIQLQFLSSARLLQGTFIVALKNGTTLTGGLGQPFIVNENPG